MVFFLFISLIFFSVSSQTSDISSTNSPESSRSFNESSIFSSDLCDLVTEAGICLFNGEKVLTADAQPKGIVGHWSFDDAYVQNFIQFSQSFLNFIVFRSLRQ